MPKYEIYVDTNAYINYVAECENYQEAVERGRKDFKERILSLLIDKYVDIAANQVDDDTPEGDC